MVAKYRLSSFLCMMVLSYQLVSQCISDSHSPFENQGWLSCQTSESAVKERGKTHWIQYDLGEEYSLKDLRLWNHNVWGQTGLGVKFIALDYSQNGSDWTSFGTLDIEEAPGSWKYVAPDPFDLGGLTAQYVLITVLETWDSDADCSGFAEVRFGVESVTSTEDEFISKTQFSIYPNPATDNIRLDFGDSEKKEIYIVNSIGQTVKKVKSDNQSSLDISIVDLEEGMYYINIQSKDLIETNSFIKI